MAENKLNQIGTLDIKGKDCIKRVYSIHGISPTLNTNGGGNHEPKIVVPNEANFTKISTCK